MSDFLSMFDSTTLLRAEDIIGKTVTGKVSKISADSIGENSDDFIRIDVKEARVNDEDWGIVAFSVPTVNTKQWMDRLETDEIEDVVKQMQRVCGNYVFYRPQGTRKSARGAYVIATIQFSDEPFTDTPF